MATAFAAKAVLGYSSTKRKALAEAKAMQARVLREHQASGDEPPPYTFLELIGKGSFGRVYKAATSGGGPRKLVAIKVISIEAADNAASLARGSGGSGGTTSDTFGDILREINALKLLSTTGARNINVIVDALLVGQAMWVVTEYCAGGSVASLMRPTGRLPERWIVPVLREVAEALFWVHGQGIIHRDVKCANVLVTDAGCVQLCDFGVAAVVETSYDKRSTVTGTLQWMAPELFDDQVSYGSEVDIWAFGSLAYEAASGHPPNATYAAVDLDDFSAHLRRHCPRLEGEQYSFQLRDFVAQCMVLNPAQRPAIGMIQKHPYIYNTSAEYPTSSLAALVSSYRLWESQGGSRHSLFGQGGAQVPVDDLHRDNQASAEDDEWDFSTIVNGLDSQATSHMVVDSAPSNEDTYRPVSSSRNQQALTPESQQSQPQPQQRRRRRPVDIRPLIAPLEKAFNPHTITNYHDNVRAFYDRSYSAPVVTTTDSAGKPAPDLLVPPSLPTLPSPDGKTNDLGAIRASIIDLDASLDDCELLEFEEVETLRAILKSFSSDAVDADAAVVSNANVNIEQYPERRTRDWTFPVAKPISSGSNSSSSSSRSNSTTTAADLYTPPISRSTSEKYPADHIRNPSRFSLPTSLAVPGSSSSSSSDPSVPVPPRNRALSVPSHHDSVVSLIDLDASIASIVADDTATTRPPSTGLSTDSVPGGRTFASAASSSNKLRRESVDSLIGLDASLSSMIIDVHAVGKSEMPIIVTVPAPVTPTVIHQAVSSLTTQQSPLLSKCESVVSLIDLDASLLPSSIAIRQAPTALTTQLPPLGKCESVLSLIDLDASLPSIVVDATADFAPPSREGRASSPTTTISSFSFSTISSSSSSAFSTLSHAQSQNHQIPLSGSHQLPPLGHRESMMSLIDLDESVPATVVVLDDAASARSQVSVISILDAPTLVSLTQAPSRDQLSHQREPSLYVSDDAYLYTTTTTPATTIATLIGDGNTAQEVGPFNASIPRAAPEPGTLASTLAFPVDSTPPAIKTAPAPTVGVATGPVSSREEMKADLRRLAAHLLRRLPVRQGEKGSVAE